MGDPAADHKPFADIGDPAYFGSGACEATRPTGVVPQNLCES
jgi:hypothetical protein